MATIFERPRAAALVAAVRLAVTSDIHIDLNGPAVLDALCARIREVRPDVLIVAGDIATGATTFLSTLLALRPCAPEMLVVAGNHDVWTSQEAKARGIDSWTWLDKLLPALCVEAGAKLLDAGPVKLGNIGFAGSLGWFDFTMREHLLDAPMDAYRKGLYAGVRWNDHRYAHFPDAQGETLPSETIAALLRDRLSAHLAALDCNRVVVATHMLAFDRQVFKKDHPAWRFVNAFMGSLRMGELLQADRRIELAIAGHTHVASDHRIGKIRALVSPLGYQKEWRAPTLVGAIYKAVAVVDL